MIQTAVNTTFGGPFHRTGSCHHDRGSSGKAYTKGQPDEGDCGAIRYSQTSLHRNSQVHVTLKIVFRNSTYRGNKPLIISNVSASCGCTMPKKPEKPIAPGKSDVIEVVFKSKPSMKNEIKKTITVTANTIKKIHKLEIRAFVK